MLDIMDISSPEMIILMVIGSVGALACIYALFMIMRILTKNQMKDSLLGKIIQRMGIAWIFTIVAIMVAGGVVFMQGLSATISTIILIMVIIAWNSLILLLIKSIRKWKKEMA